MKISLIAAMASNRVIGQNNQLPRDYPEDLKRFRKLTSGHTIVMGRKTYESIGRPLPKRRNIVLTRGWNIEGVETFSSIDQLLDTLYSEETPDCKLWDSCKEEEIFIIGGSEIYKQFLNKADYIYLTLIKKNYEWDTFFPEFEQNYKEIEREKFKKFDFILYRRK